MTNCGLAAGAQGPARARRGLSRIDAGIPVARARSPTQPAPKSEESSRFLRERVHDRDSFEHADHMPTNEGETQAATKVDWSASVGVIVLVLGGVGADASAAM